jgi:bacteriocin biosynthesis cyclodehydratase domain-containing protein
VTAIPDRPLLPPWYRLARRPGRYVLEYGHRAVVLEGRATERLVPALLPLLDGRRTVPEIVAELGAAADEAVRRALALLGDNGLLVDGPPADADAGALDTANLLAATTRRGSPGEHAAALADSSVAIAGTAGVATRLALLLREAGVGELVTTPLGADPPDAALCVVAPASPEVAAVEAWNESALATSRPWLQMLPFDGRFVAIGPLFVPGAGPCGKCYALRRRACLGFGADHDALAAVAADRPSAPHLDAAAAAVAAGIVLRWLVGDTSVASTLHALECAPDITLSSHRVLRVPRCTACSPAARSAPLLPWHTAAA